MTWTLCTSGAAIAKAGLYANTTIVASGTCLANWSDESESLAFSLTRVNFTFSGLTANGKQIFQELTSSHIAQKIIMYDMSGYTSRGEAVQILNILENNIQRCIKLISDDNNVKNYLAVN